MSTEPSASRLSLADRQVLLHALQDDHQRLPRWWDTTTPMHTRLLLYGYIIEDFWTDTATQHRLHLAQQAWIRRARQALRQGGWETALAYLLHARQAQAEAHRRGWRVTAAGRAAVEGRPS
jgi:NDP-sugar pyrophosphorylase family protein